MWAYLLNVQYVNEEKHSICDISRGTTNWLHFSNYFSSKITKIVEERWQGKKEWDKRSFNLNQGENVYS